MLASRQTLGVAETTRAAAPNSTAGVPSHSLGGLYLREAGPLHFCAADLGMESPVELQADVTADDDLLEGRRIIVAQ